MKLEEYLDYSNKTILLTIIIVAIIGIVLFLHVESVDKLEEVEKGNYSYITQTSHLNKCLCTLKIQ